MRHRQTHAASGFTLVEVLVALLIVALGMLGNAMLQLQGMKNSNDAYFRSQIGIFGYDVADRIRANRECQNSYLTQGTLTAGNPFIVGTTAAGVCNQTTGLGNGNMANEIACIGQSLTNGLPAGSQAFLASNTFIPAGANANVTVFTLTVDWFDRDGEQHVITYSFDPGACATRGNCNSGNPC